MVKVIEYLCYIMNQSFRYIEPYAKRPDQRFYMSAVGLHEWMEPEIVNRPNGTWDRLIMFFHTPVKVQVNGQVSDYPANTLMIWEDFAPHYYGNPTDRWDHSWLHVKGTIMPELLAQAGLASGVYPDLHIEASLQRYMPQIHEERVRNDMDPLIVEGLFACLLRDIGRVLSPTHNEIPERIHALKQYLDSHYAETIRLDDLGRRAAMSKPHLISEFRKYLGVPPIDYLIDIRMEHARSLLLNRNLSITVVAERVGYPDIYHFSKLFKKRLGHSPSEFRNRSPEPDQLSVRIRQ